MNCKNAAILFIIFLIFSFVVMLLPVVTECDIRCIQLIQNRLVNVDSSIPIMAGGMLFYIMTCIPLLIGGIYFLIHKMYRLLLLFFAVPFLSYFLNSIIKAIVQRPRPPIELQFEEHMSSSSYVSRHTFVTACVWGMFIYFVCRYCKNNSVKYLLLSLSVVWILFEGFSRIWMGVHNPTDVIGALILSLVFLLLYIRMLEKMRL